MAKLLKLNAGTVTEGVLSEPASGGVVALNDGSLQFFLGTASGTTPGANIISPVAVSCANRMMLGVFEPDGDIEIQQPHFMNGSIGWNTTYGATTTVLTPVGAYRTLSVVGTATSRAFGTSNMYARAKKLGYVSAATAGSLVSLYTTTGMVTVGNGSGLGGFYKSIIFGISDASAVSGARMFVGVSSTTGAPTNVEPSTLTNSIGVGHGAADTNLKIFYGGSAAQTPIDLGVNFPSTTLSTDIYKLELYSTGNSSTNVYYKVTRLNTGNTATGTLTDAGAGVQLPTPTTYLCHTRIFRTNNATALAVGFDFFSDYIESNT